MTGSEIIPLAQELIGKIDHTILEAATKGLATAIGKVAGEAGIKLLGGTGGVLVDGTGNLTKAAQDLLFRISRRYIANYTERHGTLKVLGMGKPVSLDSIYTKVNFQADAIRAYQSVDAQEQVFRKREKNEQDTQPGIDVANQEKYLMVLGNPGTGKTTFLRKVGLEALKGNRNGEYQHTCIPVLLELRKFRSGEIDLVKEIASEFQNCGLPEYQECTVRLLEKGKLLILLDGLDEVQSGLLSKITNQIRDLLDCYSDNRFIVTCRIATYRNFDNFRRFTDVAIAHFDDEQIETFICKWFESHSQQEWGQQCWEKLNSGDYQATKELTRTPLLLTLICILFRKRGEFPNKRATVYNETLWTLLSEWDASKEIVRSAPYQGLDTKCKEVMLAEIAHDNFIADNLFFQQGEITNQIESILGEMLPDKKLIDGKAVLRAIEEQHGILIKRTDDIYSFSHLTFQEFLTAKHIVDNYKDIEIEKLLVNHLCDRRWREVFLILAGLRRSDSLLLLMEKFTQQFSTNSNLQDLLLLVEQSIDNSSKDISLVGKRAVILSNILILGLINIYSKQYELVYDYSLANAYASGLVIVLANIRCFTNGNAYKLANAKYEAINQFTSYIYLLRKFKIFKNINFAELLTLLENCKDQASKNMNQEIVNQIIQTSLKTFHINSEIINLSTEDIKMLSNYIYSNLLLVSCRFAAIRLSKNTWLDIESRMLLPLKN